MEKEPNGEECVELKEIKDDHEKQTSDINGTNDIQNGVQGKWIVVFCTCVIFTIDSVFASAFPVLYVEWIEYFQSSRGETGWIVSIGPIFNSLLTILYGTLIELLGCPVVSMLGSTIMAIGCLISSFAPNILVLTITYGLVTGMGNSMSGLACMIILQKVFSGHKYLPLALGIAMCGDSIGTLICAPMVQALIDEFGWRGTMLITSAIVLNTVPFAILYGIHTKRMDSMSKINEGKTKQTKRELHICQNFAKTLCDISILKCPRVIIFLWGNVFTFFGMIPFYTHLTSRAVFYGVSKQHAAILPPITGAGSFIGRLCFGFLASQKMINIALLLPGLILPAGILTIVFGLANTFAIFTVFCIVCGVLNGGILVLSPSVLLNIAGKEQITRAQTFNRMAVGVSALICTPAVGYIFDLTKDYGLPFYIVGGIEAIGGIIFLTMLCIRRPKRQDVSQVQIS